MESEREPEHGCIECYEINKGFHSVKNGMKKCDECGGTVFTTQEAFDHIAELKSLLKVLVND